MILSILFLGICFFAPHVRKAIIDECIDICEYAETDHRIKGIVMHTDFPLSKQIKDSTCLSDVDETYMSSLWDVDTIKRCVENVNFNDFVTESLDEFYMDFKEWTTKTYRCKIYLKNSTKTYNNTSTVTGLRSYLMTNPSYTDVYGLCIDTEHSYAAGGMFPDVHDIINLVKLESTPCIVHLNTIPEGVVPNSGKDRHSYTTVCECQLNTDNYYIDYMYTLDEHNISYVREVKQETMFREISQLTSYGCYD